MLQYARIGKPKMNILIETELMYVAAENERASEQASETDYCNERKCSSTFLLHFPQQAFSSRNFYFLLSLTSTYSSYTSKPINSVDTDFLFLNHLHKISFHLSLFRPSETL